MNIIAQSLNGASAFIHPDYVSSTGPDWSVSVFGIRMPTIVFFGWLILFAVITMGTALFVYWLVDKRLKNKRISNFQKEN